MLKRIIQITLREYGVLLHNPIYGFRMVISPILIIISFTSLMNEGQPVKMPIDVVNLDDTATSRKLTRNLDSYQMSHVVAHYSNTDDAWQAIQRNRIYAFLFIPKGMTSDLASICQLKISFYHSSVSFAVGSTLHKDLKTIMTLGSAGVASTKLTTTGKTNDEVRIFLQPTAIDLHMISSPLANYNAYLSTTMIPGVLLIFMSLVPVCSIDTELKFKESKKWLVMASNNIYVATAGKILPQTAIFLTTFYTFEIYIYYVLSFPHPGGFFPILLLGLLMMLAGQGFSISAFNLVPSLCVSMSVCSLRAILSFTTNGATYPVFPISPMIEAMAQLFPFRHYYMIYQQCIFNSFPLTDAWLNLLALCIFVILPIFTLCNIKRVMFTYVYIP